MNHAVSSVAWPWRKRQEDESETRPKPRVWVCALRQSAIMTVIGSALFWWLGHRVMGGIVWSLAAVVLASGMFVPAVFAAIERFGKRLGEWAGQGLTWGLLAPFFYGFFVPMRAWLKLRGKDPLERRLIAGKATYWTPREPLQDASRYRKQF